MNPLGMGISLNVDSSTPLYVAGDFDTPTFNAAAFAQATFKNLLIDRLDLTAGIRLDYEHASMDYYSGCNIDANFKMYMDNRYLYDIYYKTTSLYDGKHKKDDTQIAPKIALTYHINDNSIIYASAAKGFRAGGYNLQMFSTLVQSSMRNDMMTELQKLAPTIASNFDRMITANPSADSTIVYKPETSWNFEIGTHMEVIEDKLTANAAIFFVDTRNQQIAKYTDSGLGRMMVNAGHSQSYGGELSLISNWQLGKDMLSATASYGYTHAEFRDFFAGTYNGEELNYKGNAVPFAPRHTLALTTDYTCFSKKNKTDKSILGKGITKKGAVKFISMSAGADLRGCGKTYWTESNNASQPFYMLLGAHIGADLNAFTINIWGTNLTNHKYVPFYFESMSKGFAQTNKPIQFGVDLTIKL
jgi:outer membrane receptor protein involved in Fe transport